MRIAALSVLAVSTLLLAAPAHAVEVGTSIGLGTGGVGLGGNPFDRGFRDAFGPRSFVPSLDLRFEPLHLQLHVLEFLDHLADDGRLFLGGNLYYQVHDAPITDAWSGVVQPGVSLDLLADDGLYLAAAGECRVGMQAASSAGFGLYLVPSVGFLAGPNTSGLLMGGTLQMSVWFGG